jgi:hypothetical protein
MTVDLYPSDRYAQYVRILNSGENQYSVEEARLIIETLDILIDLIFESENSLTRD